MRVHNSNSSNKITALSANSVKNNSNSSKTSKKTKTDETSYVETNFEDEGKNIEKNIKKKIKSGQLKKDKNGCYIYTSNGKETYGDIKEQLGLENGVLRLYNMDIFYKISGNADEVKPDKGTKIRIPAMELPPSKPANFKDDNGEKITGFYRDRDGGLFYKIQPGDTQTSIQKKLSNKCFKYYDTSDILGTAKRDNISAGTKISISEKGPISKFFTWLFG